VQAEAVITWFFTSAFEINYDLVLDRTIGADGCFGNGVDAPKILNNWIYFFLGAAAGANEGYEKQ